MGRTRRGGYIFFTAKGDHSPRHVHIYRDNRLVAKFDLDRWKPMIGNIDRRIQQALEELVKEKKL